MNATRALVEVCDHHKETSLRERVALLNIMDDQSMLHMAR